MKHQIFVIAKAGNYYRSLAAIENPNLSGLEVLKRCLLLLRIFSHPKNRIPLQQELRFAKEFFRDQPPPAALPTDALENADAFHRPCPFPFTTTCLIVGGSFDCDNGRIDVVFEELFGVGYGQEDTEDDMTILDITDPGNIKYCFMNMPQEPKKTEERLPRIVNEPLNGWQYLESFYKISDRIVQQNIHVPESLQKVPLITTHTLADLWPWVSWNVAGYPADKSGSLLGPKGLLQQTAAALVDAVLFHNDQDDLNPITDFIQQVPNVRPILRDAILERADEVGKTAVSLFLLGLVYEGEQHLDWSAFVNLDAAGLSSALQTLSRQQVASINLSGTKFSQATSELWSSLSHLAHPNIYLLEPPSRLDDESSKSISTEFTTLSPQPKINRLVMSSLMSRPFRPRSGQLFPDTSAAPPLVESFPIVQLLVTHGKEGAVDKLLPVWPYEYFFLGDAFLSPTRFITGLFRYMRNMIGLRASFDNTSGFDAAMCFAASSSSLSDGEIGEINVLPADIFNFSRLSFRSVRLSGRYSEMRDLVPGQWTVLLTRTVSFPESLDLEAVATDKNVTTKFHCAFVRPKRKILAKSRAKRDVELQSEDVDVFDLRGFLQETIPHANFNNLRPLFEQLIEHTSPKIERQHTSTNIPSQTHDKYDRILAYLSAEQACNLVTRFMDNTVVVQNRKEKIKYWTST
ncbi:unnamed protein product [Clonostachys byssicola]|uniref:Uncharacterized protein n=1 Tax=Clonostachys byssicola TaxID=160290 RepID=A0A9N9XXW2_9HYPO|nr:unnamed protein product [Clonostachys byssicola]